MSINSQRCLFEALRCKKLKCNFETDDILWASCSSTVEFLLRLIVKCVALCLDVENDTLALKFYETNWELSHLNYSFVIISSIILEKILWLRWGGSVRNDWVFYSCVIAYYHCTLLIGAAFCVVLFSQKQVNNCVTEQNHIEEKGKE